MLELIQKFFIGHVHHWEIIEEINVKNRTYGNIHKLIKVCKCKHCGKIKQIDIN